MNLKKLIYFSGISLTLLLLITACTQSKIELGTPLNEKAMIRSTQADCDCLQLNLPPTSTAKNYCTKLAELLQCRLNQGIDEDDVINNCDQIDSEIFPYCLNTSHFLLNYPVVVDSLQRYVYENTDPCPPTYCPFPTNQSACRIIIFSVSFSSSMCGTDNCKMNIQADVYCCM